MLEETATVVVCMLIIILIIGVAITSRDSKTSSISSISSSSNKEAFLETTPCGDIVASAWTLKSFAGTPCVGVSTRDPIVAGVGEFGELVYDGDEISLITEGSMNDPMSLARVFKTNFIVESVCQKAPMSSANPADPRQILMKNTFFRLLDTRRTLMMSNENSTISMIPLNTTPTTGDVFYLDVKDPSKVKAVIGTFVESGYPLSSSMGVVLHSALGGGIVSFDWSTGMNVGIRKSTTWMNYGLAVCKINCTVASNCLGGPCTF